MLRGLQVMETSDFMKRRAAAEEYNTGNRFRKRGLALIPTKFGISFTTMFLNQVRTPYKLQPYTHFAMPNPTPASPSQSAVPAAAVCA